MSQCHPAFNAPGRCWARSGPLVTRDKATDFHVPHCHTAFQVLAQKWPIGPGMLLFSACTAFALNVSIFLLIGKTSALTMNVAGVIKDVVLVYLSMSLFG